ncbi:MAG: PQQ-binding-like beta-propeller repeat protein, partial [Planctomycetes bacterium]|nr:PQQ-binding-like beta-propeller repeat protein [Planctomycetota bacterium]
MTNLSTCLVRRLGVFAFCVITSLTVQAAQNPALLVEESGLSGGIIVVLDNVEGGFLSDLAVNSSFLVQGLSAHKIDIEKARQAVQARGLYGQVSCNQYNGSELPYVDDLINLVLCEESTRVHRDELIRVIAPGGMLMIKTGNGWKKIVKPRPAGMDEWNQFLHDADNNGVSLDDVGAPQRLRWHDVPEFGRSKSISPSVTNMVSANGIVFTIEDRATTENVNAPVEYRLVARDAFNGIQLWSQPMQLWSNWQTFSIKSISTQQQRCLAAVGDYVYCCPEFGGPVTVFNARTGEQTKVFSETVRTREFAIENNVLYGIKGAPYAMDGHGDYRNNKTYALNLNTGTLKWNKKIAAEYVGGTLAVKGDYLVRYTSDGLTCMRADDGKIIWTQPIKPKSEKPRRSKNFSRQNSESEVVKYDSSALFSYNIHPTVVLTDDTVFVGVVDEIVAKNLRTGGTLWREPSLGNYRKSPDLFVAGGLVWGNSLKGHDPKTGKVVTQLTQEMTGPMSHDRCYRNRITHRYYLSSASGGIDLLELNGKSEQPNPWARSTCGLSAMPANGMIYNAPYVCQCIIGALITGFNAMYNGSGNTDERFTVSLSPRLIKGPAFGFTGGGAATAGDWPAYRGSSMRSAVTDIEAPTQIAKKWKAEIGPHPTAPVVVGDSVYVASRETHTIVALNSTTGDKRWTFTAGGRIDSPPSYYRGLVVFGSRGGWVYCLRASDGELLWKFNGLPERRLICSSGQLESAWPVNGSVMVYQDTFYFAGGRSSFLDGGIAVFGLDPFTGQMKHGKMMQGPYQDNNRNFPIETGEF